MTRVDDKPRVPDATEMTVVNEVAQASVPIGARVVVVANLRLDGREDASTEIVTAQLAAMFDAIDGPALVVFAGDVFDFSDHDPPDPARSLAAHSRFTAALERFSGREDQRVVVLAGELDAELLTYAPASRVITGRAWTLARSLDLAIQTGTGERRVRIAHGGGEPKVDAVATHVVETVDLDDGDEIPSLLRGHGFLDGADSLDEHDSARQFVVSRWFTRRFLRRFGIPIVGGLIAEVWLALADTDGTPFTIASIIAIVAMSSALVVGLWLRRWSRRIAHEVELNLDSAARHELRLQVTTLVRDGFHGAVFGRVQRPELIDLGQQVFAANTGSCAPVVVRYRSWIGIPVFRSERQVSWVELESGNRLHVKLVVSRTPILDEPWIEHALQRTGSASAVEPTIVASLPDGPTSWTESSARANLTLRYRKFAAIALLAAGIANLLSAATAPLAQRAHALNRVVPLLVPESARWLSLAVGVALVLIARGVRRGRRSAFVVAIAFLGLSAVLNLLKGLDVEEGLLAAAIVAWLIAHRFAFRVRTPWRNRAEPRTDLARAREIINAHTGDTLAYFALRNDKRWFFAANSVVAYRVFRDMCLVSPDPIGPPSQHREVWRAFLEYAQDNGWTVGVVAASAEWLPIYEASGFRSLYIGDEAIVDVDTFSLEGAANKSLRNGVSRARRRGYTIEYFQDVALPDDVDRALRAMMTQSRRGDAERGFSMTLGRFFDPQDQGLLLAVAFNAEHQPVAFCQYVPADNIDGYSLDLMRRDEAETTNGLIDLVVVETIEYLKRNGRGGLGLNFATLRTVVSGEHHGDSLARLERWAIDKVGDDMQIESLWRYNEKFRPRWQPRYLVVSRRRDLPAAMLAFAQAESWFELPLIGRFLAPDK